MARLPETRPSLAREIRYQKRQVRRLGTASPFTRSGATVTQDSVTEVDGQWQSTDFDGNLDTGDAGTKGWAMDATAAAFGSLYLRPGSVSNNALSNPLVGQNARAVGSNFALVAGTLTELAGLDITVPAGCTQLVASAGAFVFAYNPNTTGGSNGAGGDAIYAMVKLGTQTSHANPIGVSGSGGFATSSSADAFTFTGLSAGSTLRLSVMGCCNYQAIAANTNNTCNAWALLIWLR